MLKSGQNKTSRLFPWDCGRCLNEVETQQCVISINPYKRISLEEIESSSEPSFLKINLFFSRKGGNLLSGVAGDYLRLWSSCLCLPSAGNGGALPCAQLQEFTSNETRNGSQLINHQWVTAALIVTGHEGRAHEGRALGVVPCILGCESPCSESALIWPLASAF